MGVGLTWVLVVLTDRHSGLLERKTERERERERERECERKIARQKSDENVDAT